MRGLLVHRSQAHQVNSEQLFHLAKSRWEIENQEFNDAKNRHGLAHIRHHHENSLLVCWFLLAFSLTLERLYRVRYLQFAGRPIYTAIQFLRLLRLNLAGPLRSDDS